MGVGPMMSSGSWAAYRAASPPELFGEPDDFEPNCRACDDWGSYECPDCDEGIREAHCGDDLCSGECFRDPPCVGESCRTCKGSGEITCTQCPVHRESAQPHTTRESEPGDSPETEDQP